MLLRTCRNGKESASGAPKPPKPEIRQMTLWLWLTPGVDSFLRIYQNCCVVTCKSNITLGFNDLFCMENGTTACWMSLWVQHNSDQSIPKTLFWLTLLWMFFLSCLLYIACLVYQCFRTSTAEMCINNRPPPLQLLAESLYVSVQ